MIDYIEQENPEIIISLGLSASATFIEIEKIAVNLKKESVNSQWEIPKILNPNGPFIQLSTLKTKEIAWEIRSNNIDSYQSLGTGLYICNALFYGTSCYIKENNLDIKSGFIHVPLLKTQDESGMELDQMIEAIKIAISISLRE
jgi:pyroglutamyl-peptidase